MIFVLGSEGFVGSAFLEACREHGLDHRGIDVGNYDECRGSSCDILINADGNSKKYLADDDPPLDFKLSVSSVMQSLFDFTFARYVYISSIAVYSDHADPDTNHEEAPLFTRTQTNYGFHKHMAEQLVMKYCDDWCILRLGGMVGARISKGPVFDILHGIPLRMSPASRFQFISTIDVARLALRMLEEGCAGEIFNVCGRGTVTLREIQELAGRIEENELPAETWNVNTDKAHRRFGLATTEESIRGFISGRDL